MTTAVRSAVIITLCVPLAGLGVPAAPVPLASVANERVLPDRAFREIVNEANQFIQTSLGEPGFFPVAPEPHFEVTIRSNTLLIAMAAQNRMGKAGADTGQAAALRDTAVRLAVAAGKKSLNLAEVRKLADVLNRHTELKPDPAARPGRVRLTDTFTHDDLIPLFGSGTGRKKHRIEFHLLQFGRAKTTLRREQTESVELLAYKVALSGELLREFDEFVTTTLGKKKPEELKEWVRLAGELRQAGWQLARTARSGRTEDVSPAAKALHGICNRCHEKFLDCQ